MKKISSLLLCGLVAACSRMVSGEDVKVAQNVCETQGGVDYIHRTLENELIVYCKNRVAVNASKLAPRPGK